MSLTFCLKVQSLSAFGAAPSQFSPRVLMTDRIQEDGSVNGADIPFSPIPLHTVVSDASDENGDRYDAPDLGIPQQLEPNVKDEPSGQKTKVPSKAKRVSILNFLPQTQSQIFAYAYGEIEKEKAAFGSSSYDMEVGGEYYGSVRAPMVGKLRPPIELSFVDLSLFLKGSNKKILSNVTGKLSPGRVTAVMGPSGAGKTTFLNALAGKATHSRTTGAVFINGKPDSIQSYKSIIGFVPQDDIVHGNLTVEENLWFSASYRFVALPLQRRLLLLLVLIDAAL